jgi:RimJ/RimL family protein N-acetyltransferase
MPNPSAGHARRGAAAAGSMAAVADRPRATPPDPPLTDGVVALRRAVPADRAGLLEDGRDPEMQRWTNTPDPYGDREADEELAWFLSCWDDPAKPLALVVADPATDRYLGAVVVMRDRPAGIVELGYGVNPNARGRGVGTRAVGLAARWAFAELGAARVEARTDPGNLPSQRLLAAAGFTREGVERQSRVIKGRRRDMVCWSLLPADVGAAPPPAG